MKKYMPRGLKYLLAIGLVFIASDLSNTLVPENNVIAASASELPVQYDSIEEAMAAFEITADLDKWFQRFNALTPEEQAIISYRPPNFYEIQREVYGTIMDEPYLDNSDAGPIIPTPGPTRNSQIYFNNYDIKTISPTPIPQRFPVLPHPAAPPTQKAKGLLQNYSR